MDDQAHQTPPMFVFPRWANYALPAILILVGGAGLYLPTVVGFGGSPKTTDVGYQPTQPVPFSHALHAGELGMDCRYCHNTVEQAGFAAVPATQTCMNCHTNIQRPDPAGNPAATLKPLYESWQSGKPVNWVKVHDLPDYAYFNHSAHVNKGIGCVTCHGRIDQMDVVYQAKPLSMSWCLDCHREPEKYLRPVSEITNMNYSPPGGDQLALGRQLKQQYGIRDRHYMESCSTCHR
ncbi:cytochrome c3 family protein [Fontivita pretiosa]|uniref:cytochrome c3 family protein n=1 Tax=Fontivita pretiosa TaxID=2989684 RepID=UPI003D17F6A5